MKQIEAQQIKMGNSEKMGVTIYADGVNFTVEAPAEQTVSLVLFTKRGDKIQKIPFPDECRIGDVASMYIDQLSYKKYHYAYLINDRTVLDPYASMILGDRCGFEPEIAEEYIRERSWVSLEDLIIYKLHVRGFTKKAGKKIKSKGTYRGVQEAIPYLKELGVNAIEFMPMYEWQDTRENYWGYAPVNYYLAPKMLYSSSKGVISECKEMIDQLHEAGFTCIMEFYFPGGTDAELAVAALKHWKLHYGIDGFHVIGEGTPTDLIMRTPLLKRTKLFLDRVDGWQLYGAKAPVYKNIAEYSMDFMGCGRRFLKSDAWQVTDFMYQIRKNSDKFGVVKYMANNNGFTLNDMVSYSSKHNMENEEDNRDGMAADDCWNCGEEGISHRENILALRLKQRKNAILYSMLAQGTPLIYHGDEMGNTQKGNNNAYRMDNEVGWISWKLTEGDEAFLAFVKDAIAFRKAHPILSKKKELRLTDDQGKGYPEMSYHNESAWLPEIHDTTRNIGCMYFDSDRDDFIYVAYNAHWKSCEFALPKLPEGMMWGLAIQTELAEQSGMEIGDILENQKILKVTPRTVMVLIGK